MTDNTDGQDEVRGQQDSSLILDAWLESHLATRLVDSDLRPLGLTGEEFGLYSLIHSAGPATSTQISRWSGLAKGYVLEMLGLIAARGHLDDIPHPHDACARLIRLTDEGTSVTVRAAKMLAQTPSPG